MFTTCWHLKLDTERFSLQDCNNFLILSFWIEFVVTWSFFFALQGCLTEWIQLPQHRKSSNKRYSRKSLLCPCSVYF